MGKNGHSYLGVSVSLYRYESKERRRGLILEECGNNCKRAADMMKQVIASNPDPEIMRKAKTDLKFFKEYQKSKCKK